MAETIGGGVIERYDFERGWGVNPSSASGVVVGSVDFGVGDYVAYSFGAVTFYGLVFDLREKRSVDGGVKVHFTVLDNRVRLGGQIVFGMWNMEDEEWGSRARAQPALRTGQFASSSGNNGSDGLDTGEGLDTVVPVHGVGSTNPQASPGRRRRYWSILPDQWGAQIKTWHDEPMTAREILNSAFNGAIGSYGFNRTYHAGLNKPVMGVDANNGQTLANLVSQINRDTGMDVTIDGNRGLRWERKGSGVFIAPSWPDCVDDVGVAISRQPTKITVVGGPALVQLNNIELEPDWKEAWEPFVSERVWLKEVEDLWNIDVSTNEGLAERAARAREITLGEYVRKKGAGGNAFKDYRRWGDVGRWDLPVWIYVTEIVFRSYRIPVDKDYRGIPLSSMEIHEGLLAGVEISGTGGNAKIGYRSSPVEFYPPAKAFVIARGQPLDLLDERSYEAFGRRRERDLRDEWSVVNDYTVDLAEKSIHFNAPVFLDGDPSKGESIVVYKNRGEGGGVDLKTQGVEEGKDLLDIVVPNPDYKISAAEVKASFVFSIGKFRKQFGAGVTRGIHSVPNLSQHLLDMTGGLSLPGQGVGSAGDGLAVPAGSLGNVREILYDNGKRAEEVAEAVADSVIQKSAAQLSGSYKRYGVAGTVLKSYHDSIKVTVGHGQGIVEEVRLTKSGGGPKQPVLEVEQRQRAAELYPKQRELAEEVRRLRLLGKYASKRSGGGGRDGGRKVMNRVWSHPVGDNRVSTAVIANHGNKKPEDSDAGGKWQAGHVMWLDDKGRIDKSGKRFGGVVVTGDPDKASGRDRASYTVAKTGEVPCLVQGPFKTGDVCGCEEGKNYCKSGGAKSIGVIASGAEYTGSDKVVAMVRLGSGGGSVDVGCIPWKPEFVNKGSSQSPNWKLRLGLGTVNGVVASDWNKLINISNGDGLYYIVLSVSFTDGKVSRVTYSVSSSVPPLPELDPMGKNVLPSSLKIILGAFKERKACMVWKRNLHVESYQALFEPKGNVVAGKLPYHIWWKYKVKGV